MKRLSHLIWQTIPFSRLSTLTNMISQFLIKRNLLFYVRKLIASFQYIKTNKQ